jgi:hypothetical protein
MLSHALEAVGRMCLMLLRCLRDDNKYLIRRHWCLYRPESEVILRYYGTVNYPIVFQALFLLLVPSLLNTWSDGTSPITAFIRKSFSHAYETLAGHAVFLQTSSHLSFHFLFPRWARNKMSLNFSSNRETALFELLTVHCPPHRINQLPVAMTKSLKENLGNPENDI